MTSAASRLYGYRGTNWPPLMRVYRLYYGIKGKLSLQHLFIMYFRIHNSTVDLDVNALYPHVEYPVSRGTPSLAPLVTWDHTDTWFVEFSKVLTMVRFGYLFSKNILLYSKGHIGYQKWLAYQN